MNLQELKQSMHKFGARTEALRESVALVRNNFLKPGKITNEEFELLKRATEVDQNKYILWLTKHYVMSNKQLNLVHARDVIALFDDLAKRNQIEVKDINRYSSLDELESHVLDVNKKYTKQVELRQSVKEEGRIVFENDLATVREITSYSAACKYGKDTKWCIASKDNDNYWNRYYSKGINFYFIYPKIDIAKNLSKIAVAAYPEFIKKDEMEVYDARDKLINESRFNYILKQLNLNKSIFKAKTIDDITPAIYCNVDESQIIIKGGLINVNGDVEIKIKSKKLLFKFGEVAGSFHCYNTGLTSLEGAPKSVGDCFNCTDNNLTSLKGAPKSISGYFSCAGNNLTSLKGAPKTVSGNFSCNHNNLTSLEGAPQIVGKMFSCHYNKLTSLKGAPKSVGEHFFCNHNNLTSLEGAPQSINEEFDCSYNKLTSLKGAPQFVGGTFKCEFNKLTSLEGAPKSVGYDFNCIGNKLNMTKEDIRKKIDIKGDIYI